MIVHTATLSNKIHTHTRTKSLDKQTTPNTTKTTRAAALRRARMNCSRYEGQGCRNKHTAPKIVPKPRPVATVKKPRHQLVAARSSAALVDLALSGVPPGGRARGVEDGVEGTCALPPGRGRGGI